MRENILQIIELLKAISHFINNSRASLCSPYGLSQPQAILIMDIYHHRDCTKITDICKRLNKTTNTISPLINRIIEKGFIYKQQNQSDNRVYEVFLTPYGEETLAKITEDVKKFAGPIFDCLNDDEYDCLEKSLINLNKACGL